MRLLRKPLIDMGLPAPCTPGFWGTTGGSDRGRSPCLSRSPRIRPNGEDGGQAYQSRHFPLCLEPGVRGAASPRRTIRADVATTKKKFKKV